MKGYHILPRIIELRRSINKAACDIVRFTNLLFVSLFDMQRKAACVRASKGFFFSSISIICLILGFVLGTDRVLFESNG